ncbi:hypothetical protein V3C99_000568 [Haemonchus contortus]
MDFLGFTPMKGQFRQDLLDEVAALVSSIGEEYVTIEEGDNELQGTISVALDPSPKPILVSAEDGKDYRQFETMHLPPINFLFRLPVGYPSKMPEVDVISTWMSISVKENLLCHIDGVLQANTGIPVLFLCYDAIKRFVAEMGTFDIRLNSNDFSQKHNLSGLEMLKLVREESEKAEMSAFLAQCHDCEVCFENKAGRHCVRFFPCGHSFCKDCVTTFFKEKLTSQKVSPLTCLADECESTASQKVIIELLGQKEYDRYEEILLKKALERMDDLVTCPRISCQKPSAISETTEHLATCLVCGYNFCTSCHRGYHGLHPCAWGTREVTLSQYLQASPEDRMKMALYYGGIENLEAEMEKAFEETDGRSYAWIEENSKRCPQCGIPVQKNNGCNLVVCIICDTPFCWSCEENLEETYFTHFSESPYCRATGPQIPPEDE